MPRPVSQENIDKAITALSDNPDITGKQFQELSGLSRATAYQALRVARETSDNGDQSTSDHSDNGNGGKGDNTVITDNLSSETGDNSDHKVISKPGNQDTQVIEVDSVITDSSDSGSTDNRVNQGAQLLKEPGPRVYGGRIVSRLKVEQVKKLFADNPSISGPQVARELQCSEDTAYKALRVAKEESLQDSQEYRDRVKRLMETKAKKAIEASEMQVEDRLQVMRATATRLHREAELSGSTKDLEAAMRAWRQLTEYERQVTGIAQAERQATAATGKTELTLQLPITPDQLDQIKPV